jgi:cyclic-di-AMP phosphodiesterase PgpH
LPNDRARQPAPASPTLVERLSRLLDRRWVGAVTSTVLVAAVAVTCGYVLTPGIFTQRIPYGDESLNQISTMVIKAQRDYDIPDEETTSQKRKEAVAAVKPIYRYDTSVLTAGLQRITQAFGMMRDAALAVRSRAKAAATNDEEQPAAEKPTPSKKHRPAAVEPLTEELRAAFEDRRADFSRALEATLDDDAFNALAEAEFSAIAEREAKRLLRNAMDDMVAEYRDEVSSRGVRGITVIRVDGNLQKEWDTTDVSGIRDQNAVRSEVERWTTELPDSMPLSLRRAIVQLVARNVRANLRFDASEFESRQKQAADSVKAVVIQLKRGERVIAPGEKIERRHLVVFRAMRAQAQEGDLWRVRFGASLVAALLLVVVYASSRFGLRDFRPTRKDALLMAAWLATMLALAKTGIWMADVLHDQSPGVPAAAFVAAIPFAAGAMLLRFVVGSEAALVFAIIFSPLVGMLADNSLYVGMYTLVGSLIGAHTVARAKDRAGLFKAGFWAGVVNVAMIVASSLFAGKPGVADVVSMAGLGMLGGLLATPTLVMLAAFVAEGLFGYTTDIKLLELANLNHPALKELIVQAPGTYHHSIIVGSLVEAAAEAVGANPLLARVCAYYHDIGKGRNPLYFGENQKGENPHDKIAPAMSAVIIKRHVTDGMEMARRYKLPEQVADAVAQHHGTRLVGFFFHKAVKEHEQQGGPAVDEAVYRYTGPKPQFREGALVMIADAVEASSRAMVDPTPQKLQALVQKIINAVFVDGQLDECDLTLRDLNDVARAFYRTLEAIYHTRPEYPAQAIIPPRREGAPQLVEVGREKEPGTSGEERKSDSVKRAGPG